MKKICTILLVFIIISALYSCEDMMGDFLEKAPGVDVTEDTIFSSRVQVETYIAGTYLQGINSMLPYNSIDSRSGNEHFEVTADYATDEGEPQSFWIAEWQTGSITPTNIFQCEEADGFKWRARWQAIRRCNILLERIETVPNVNEDYIKQVKGEALFIRALNYFEMFKRYGGIPIIDKRLDPTGNLLIPRSTIEEVVDFIVKGCDDAAANLPNSYPVNFRGRATKGAALILKSKTLLYAASPLFNTGTPYLDFGANNKFICYTNNDNNRWKLAADAAKAVIDWAPSGAIALVTDKGVDKNYKYVWEINDNPEIILANKQLGPTGLWSFPWNLIIPGPLGISWGGSSVPLNFQKLYEKKDGTPQTWEGGSNLNQKYLEMDPRFAQTFAYNGSRWNDIFPRIDIFQGGAHSGNCFGGVWIHKRVPDALWYGRNQVPNNIVFRLAEAYLNYAEALNEAEGPVAAAYEAVNTIRSRSGMPDLPSGLSKEQFRERVQKERTVELAYEEHRLWDLRRWLKAMEVLNGPFEGIKIYKIDGSAEFRYEPYTFENRTFKERMYLHPFEYNEVLKGYLIQNPGY
jgi:hypothetical protein